MAACLVTPCPVHPNPVGVDGGVHPHRAPGNSRLATIHPAFQFSSSLFFLRFFFFLSLYRFHSPPLSIFRVLARVCTHPPGLTLSATTSTLHSKALTSETSTSKYTTGENEIYRIFFSVPGSGARWANFNRRSKGARRLLSRKNRENLSRNGGRGCIYI